VTPSGSTTTAPTGSPLAPVIALAGGGSTSTTTPPTPTTKPGTTATTATTSGSKVVTAASKSLAFTGSGPGIGMLGVIGGALILLGFALLVLVDAPRRAISRLGFLASGATRRRARTGDLSGRFANLNPMGWRKARSEGVPDTSMTESPQPEPAQAMSAEPETGAWQQGYTAPQTRGMSDRFSRVPAASRELAQTTARHAVRTAQWLLGR
jgi:hypothetical protein